MLLGEAREGIKKFFFFLDCLSLSSLSLEERKDITSGQRGNRDQVGV